LLPLPPLPPPPTTNAARVVIPSGTVKVSLVLYVFNSAYAAGVVIELLADEDPEVPLALVPVTVKVYVVAGVKVASAYTIGVVVFVAVTLPGLDVAVKLVAATPNVVGVNAIDAPVVPTSVATGVVGTSGTATIESAPRSEFKTPLFILLIVIMKFPIRKQQKPLWLMMHKQIEHQLYQE
jgi:hypothetical protein